MLVNEVASIIHLLDDLQASILLSLLFSLISRALGVCLNFIGWGETEVGDVQIELL
jgi:hypothetical protein